jgi:hypothetical protein
MVAVAVTGAVVSAANDDELNPVPIAIEHAVTKNPSLIMLFLFI